RPGGSGDRDTGANGERALGLGRGVQARSRPGSDHGPGPRAPLVAGAGRLGLGPRAQGDGQGDRYGQERTQEGGQEGPGQEGDQGDQVEKGPGQEGDQGDQVEKGPGQEGPGQEGAQEGGQEGDQGDQVEKGPGQEGGEEDGEGDQEAPLTGDSQLAPRPSAGSVPRPHGRELRPHRGA